MLGRTPPEAMVTVPSGGCELLIVADGQLDVAGHDAGLLVVAGGVAGELKNLGGEVLEDSREVHGGTGADAGGVLASLEVGRDAADREPKARLGGRGHGLLAGLTLTTNEQMIRLMELARVARTEKWQVESREPFVEIFGSRNV